jgi:peptide/nickel transport system ATP-binding protein
MTGDSRASHTPPLLRIRDLAVRFRKSGPLAVEHASLSLFAQQTVAVVGESGSGKSVTALSVLGLLPPPRSSERTPRGEITFTRPGEAPVELLRCSDRTLRSIRGGGVAMIFQEPMTSLNPVLTIGEQVEESLLLHAPSRSSRERREACIEALGAVGIADPASRLGAHPHEFSGGMRQRVMIAMALACDPAVLIADEPTTALDVSVCAQILDLIDSLRIERRLGVLLITHDLNVVRSRADVICVMFRGRVVEYGAAPDVLASPLHPYTAALLRCAPGLHTRGTRLTTISESAPREFAADSPAAAFSPWWPGDADGHLVRVSRQPRDRWVCMRAAPPGVTLDLSPPELEWRRPGIDSAPLAALPGGAPCAS